MTNSLAVVTFEPTNGLPKDRYVNTFALKSDDPLSAAGVANGIASALDGFYNDTPAGLSMTMSQFISDSVSRATDAHRIQLYDLTGKEQAFLGGDGKIKVPAHGSPVYETTFTLGAAINPSSPMPPQVAIVATLRALGWASEPVEEPDDFDPGSAINRPRARHTGRHYLGPWSTGVTEEVSSESRPAGSIIDMIGKQYQSLENELDGVGTNLCVWSRMNGQLLTVTDVQIDNSFDIQRRRKAAPTGRTTFAL